MASKRHHSSRGFLESENGAIRKSWKNRLKIALVYPNRYAVGMSNLGFQTLYRLFNAYDAIVCERAFLPEASAAQNVPITTVESGHPLIDFDIVAFSVSFENDYLNILSILNQAALPLKAVHREPPFPLVLAGGVACMLNPEPLSPFIDCFLIGEAESLLDNFLNTFDPGKDRRSLLKQIARDVPGAYVPRFYSACYHDDGTLRSFDPVAEVPARVIRQAPGDLSNIPTNSAVLTPFTTFDATCLVEVSRGCPHGCRFCSAGYIYRPPRFRSLDLLKGCLEEGARRTDRIGLVGAAVSDLPEIDTLCRQACDKDIRLSFSSFRADALTPELLAVLKKSRVKTATIAPDAGSQRMRDVINKGISEDTILAATRTLVSAGIPNLKLYFMVGLPFEDPSDIDAIVSLCLKIRRCFLEASRPVGRIGQITVSISSFVPKPFTPFQWVAMHPSARLKKNIRHIRKGLASIANIRISSDNPRRAFIQALLSRGDRRVGELLELAHRHNGNWPRAIKESSLVPDFFVLRERSTDEKLPWDFIDSGIDTKYLIREFRRAAKGRTTPVCSPGTCRLCGACDGAAPESLVAAPS